MTTPASDSKRVGTWQAVTNSKGKTFHHLHYPQETNEVKELPPPLEASPNPDILTPDESVLMETSGIVETELPTAESFSKDLKHVEQKISLDKLEENHRQLLGEPSTPVLSTMEVEEEVKKCPRCKKDVPPTVKNCSTCGHYNPAHGETFDVSKVDFDLPNIFGQRLPPTERAMNPHDLPPPSVPSGTDISTHRETNEWILNHLPLKEDEKKKLLDDMTREMGEDIKEKTKKDRADTLVLRRKENTEKLREIRDSRRQKKEQKRTGVKNSLSRKP